MKHLYIILLILPLMGFGQCQKNKDSYNDKKFGYGPPLKSITMDGYRLSEIYDDTLDPKLEYIHTYNGDIIYEWYGNRDEINEINFSVLEYINGLYFHNDTLYDGNVFHSNYEVKEKYCCDNCTPLDVLIKNDFIVRKGRKK